MAVNISLYVRSYHSLGKILYSQPSTFLVCVCLTYTNFMLTPRFIKALAIFFYRLNFFSFASRSILYSATTYISLEGIYQLGLHCSFLPCIFIVRGSNFFYLLSCQILPLEQALSNWLEFVMANY